MKIEISEIGNIKLGNWNFEALFKNVILNINNNNNNNED